MSKSRFQFLQKDFPELFALCLGAEEATDKNLLLLRMRIVIEKSC